MSTGINLPVLLGQLPYLSKLTSEEQTKPETQTAFAERLAQEEAQREKSSVANVDPKTGTKAVDNESRENQNSHHHELKDRADQDHEGNPEEQDAKPIQTPWAGNIINVKI